MVTTTAVGPRSGAATGRPTCWTRCEPSSSSDSGAVGATDGAVPAAIVGADPAVGGDHGARSEVEAAAPLAAGISVRAVACRIARIQF